MKKGIRYVLPVVCVFCVTALIIFVLQSCFSTNISNYKKQTRIESEAGYTFEVDGNNEITLIKCENSTEIMKIPQTISSYKVKKLGCIEEPALVGVALTGIFEGNSDIRVLIIPEGVEETYGPAIYNCNNLKRITVPKSELIYTKK